jgi:hypothetical protein
MRPDQKTIPDAQHGYPVLIGFVPPLMMLPD